MFGPVRHSVRNLLLACLLLSLGCSTPEGKPPRQPAAADTLTAATTTVWDPTRDTAFIAEQSSPATPPMRVGNGVTAPVVLKRVDPDYRACKEEQRLWGLPILEAVVDERGRPANIRVLKPIHPCLEKVIVAAVKQWEFEPGTFEGKPVPVIFNLTVHIRWE
jgi:outer membrane biosynthesis protein TonB